MEKSNKQMAQTDEEQDFLKWWNALEVECRKRNEYLAERPKFYAALAYLEGRKKEGETMTENKYIRVWRFEDAPKKYQKLSKNGGDEDWVAEVPKAILDKYGEPAWLQSSAFGCCDVDVFELENGDKIFIGCHS